jgi:hypothetical protein
VSGKPNKHGKKAGFYGRLMGDFFMHPKTNGVSLAAIGAWTMTLAWCVARRSDGAFTAHDFATVCGGRVEAKKTKALLAELISRGLVDDKGGGLYQLHDYADHNITRAQYEADCAREAESKRTRRAASSTDGEDVRTSATVRADKERTPDVVRVDVRPVSGGDAPNPDPDPASREGGSSERGEPSFSEPDPWWDVDGYQTDGGLQ